MDGEDGLAEGELSNEQDRRDFTGRLRGEWPRADRTGHQGTEAPPEAEPEPEVGTGRLAAALMLGLSVLAVVFAALAVWLMLT